jgi:hypothetical protein
VPIVRGENLLSRLDGFGCYYVYSECRVSVCGCVCRFGLCSFEGSIVHLWGVSCVAELRKAEAEAWFSETINNIVTGRDVHECFIMGGGGRVEIANVHREVDAHPCVWGDGGACMYAPSGEKPSTCSGDFPYCSWYPGGFPDFD